MNLLPFKSFPDLEHKFNLIKQAYIKRNKEIAKRLKKEGIPYTKISNTFILVDVSKIKDSVNFNEIFPSIDISKAFAEAELKNLSDNKVKKLPIKNKNIVNKKHL